jgi:SAM-dependent methyltransferase
MPIPPSFPDYFSTVASRYAEFRPRYPAALFEYLAGLVASRAVAWDCAAGTGQASEGLAEYFEKVIATDGSAEQIHAAQPCPRVEYRVALAEESGLEAASVDLVTVSQALHWFQLDKFYAEVKRVLKPGGVLAVWCYGVHELDEPELHAAALRFYAETLGTYWPESRALVESGYRTLPFPEPELTPPTFEMETHWCLDELLGYYSTWSARTRYLKETGNDPLAPLREELAALWGDAERKRRVRWPLSVRVARY